MSLSRLQEPENSSIYSKMRVYDGESLKDTDPKAWETINTMQDHLNDIKKGELNELFKNNVVDFIREKFHFEEADENILYKMCGIITTNAFEIKHNGSKVRGLYNLASKLTHSCVPNTKHVFEDDLTGVFMTTVKVPKGKMLTANYTQLLWNTMARRQHLKVRIDFLYLYSSTFKY